MGPPSDKPASPARSSTSRAGTTPATSSQSRWRTRHRTGARPTGIGRTGARARRSPVERIVEIHASDIECRHGGGEHSQRRCSGAPPARAVPAITLRPHRRQVRDAPELQRRAPADHAPSCERTHSDSLARCRCRNRRSHMRRRQHVPGVGLDFQMRRQTRARGRAPARPSARLCVELQALERSRNTGT